MKLRSAKVIPAIIAAFVISVTCGVQVASHFYPEFDFLRRLEWITYDWRMRESINYAPPVSPHLGAVFIEEGDLSYFNTNEYYGFSFPWPRQLYGRLVDELNARGAKAIAFDMLFVEQHERTASTDITLENGKTYGSDEYFAQQLGLGTNVILAATRDGSTLVVPAKIFRTNAMLAHIEGSTDEDGVRRRATPFNYMGDYGRVWDMGIVLAAKVLGADLNKATVEPDRIVLHGQYGDRVIPLNRDGTFYIDWTIEWADERLAMDRFARVIEAQTDVNWEGKLVVVGTLGKGNNISDIGSTPLAPVTYLVSKHWNVANSVLTNQFIHPSSLVINLAILILFGAFAAVVTWNERAVVATIAVLLTMGLYVIFALFVFRYGRYWVPIALPVAGSLMATHVCLLVHRVIFERDERQRVRAVFSKIVSPNVVNELLGSETISLGGARREITVFFSDVRGFTEMTDNIQAAAEEYVRANNLSGPEAERFYDKIAAETLATVNLYLATIADMVKKYDGTLDKYIGDCVMAFWGAPTQNERHALFAVRSAIEAQRAVAQLNLERAAENERRTAAGRSSSLEMLPLLAVGCGINTGQAIVGLMGSDAHIVNYTVFGREVNLASRLEGVSGRSRIIISEATYLKILRDDPKLAAICKEGEAVHVKGISKAVKIFEVPWKIPAPEESKSALQETPTATTEADSGKK